MGKRSSISACKRLATFIIAALSLCLVGSLAGLNIQKAQAASLNLETPCSVKVEPPADVTLKCKLYMVGTAEQQPGYDAYFFNPTEKFSSLDVDIKAASSTTETGTYKELSQKVASMVATPANSITPSYVFNAGSSQTVEPGLYFLVAYGENAVSNTSKDANVLVKNSASGDSDSTYVSVAYSNTQKFTFTPELIAIPTKAPEKGVVNTANTGDWIYDQTVTLKPAITNRTGSLVINKKLLEFEKTESVANNDATFVFDIKGYATVETTGTPIYSNVASVTFDAAGNKQAVVENIPAGLYVVVTEVYSGTSYELASNTSQTAQIVATDNLTVSVSPASVNFENVYNGNPNEGGSVINSFQNEEGIGWTWSKDGEVQGGDA